MKWPAHKMFPLLGVIAVVIIIALLPTGEQGESATPVKSSPHELQSPRSQPATQQPEQVHVELERLNKQKTQEEAGKPVTNAFKSTSWYVAKPAPPPPPPPPPPEPTAPPLPFTYMGRYEDPPKLLVILASGSKVYTVSEGDVIDGNYRVDRITDSVVNLVYLPLNINQSLSTTGTPDNSPRRAGADEHNRRP